MIEECELELELTSSNEKFLKAIINALKPDTRNLPEKCSIDLNIFSDRLVIKIICKKISNLRTLFFSYYTILSTLIDLGEVSK